MGWQTEVVVQLLAGNSIINPLGFFVYSGTPGAGNLIFSVAPASTTADNFGNAVIGGGATTYAAGQDAQLTAGSLVFNAVPAGAAGGTIAANGSGIILLNSGLITGGDTSSQIAVESQSASGQAGGLVAILGVLSVNGSTQTTQNGVSSPGIVGTSGPASAGTAHTHSAGSYTLGSGQHKHSSFGG